jgi:hypothetical protein
MFELKVLRTEAEFLELQPDWRALLLDCAQGSIYLTWEWMYTWWQVFSDHRIRPHILCLYQNQVLRAIAPLAIAEHRPFLVPFRQLFFMGTLEDEADEVCTNYLDVIADSRAADYPALIGRVAVHLGELLQRGQVHEVNLKNLHPDSQLPGHTESLPASIRRDQSNLERCALVIPPATWDEYLGQLGKPWRKSIRSTFRKAEGPGRAESTYFTGDSQIVSAAFDRFIELHQQRWQQQGRGGLFSSQRFERFHRTLIRRFDNSRTVCFHELQFDGRLVASCYLFHFDGVIYRYLPACVHEARGEIRFGFFERVLTIQDGIEQPVKRIDFYKAHPQSYKWHLANAHWTVSDLQLRKRSLPLAADRLSRFCGRIGRRVRQKLFRKE